MSQSETLPRRQILTPENLASFLASPTHTKIVNFITALSESVKDVPTTKVPGPPSEIIIELCGLLDKIDGLITENPPEGKALIKL